MLYDSDILESPATSRTCVYIEVLVVPASLVKQCALVGQIRSVRDIRSLYLAQPDLLKVDAARDWSIQKLI